MGLQRVRHDWVTFTFTSWPPRCYVTGPPAPASLSPCPAHQVPVPNLLVLPRIHGAHSHLSCCSFNLGDVCQFPELAPCVNETANFPKSFPWPSVYTVLSSINLPSILTPLRTTCFVVHVFFNLCVYCPSPLLTYELRPRTHLFASVWNHA